MYFTKAQIRALWFVVIVFGASVLLHYAQVWFASGETQDFSAFEKAFVQKRDSLLHAEEMLTNAPSTKSNGADEEDREEPSASVAGFPININSAGPEALQALPRVGPKMAERIVRYRTENGPFRTREDLMKVKGIGKKTFEKLKDLVTVK